MEFSFSDEQQAMVDLAKQIFSDGATLDRMKALEQSDGHRFDEALWKELASSGLLGVAIPEAYGGAELGFMELAGIIEQLGAAVAPVPFIETAVLGALPIAEFGSEAQKQAWLPGVSEGSVILTAALYEAQGEIGETHTQASPQGAGFTLSGTKMCVPAAQIAARVLVPARDPEGRLGVFLVDPHADGVKLTTLLATNGQPEAVLQLDGAAGELLGDLDRGAQIVDWIGERGTAALCSLALGVCQKALDLTAEYTKGREQFGQAIATFQAVGQRAADAYVDTEAIRLTSWQAAWRIAEGLPASAQVAVAKFWAAEAGQRVVHTAQHLHGGVGVDRDYPLFRYFLYARHLELSLGGSAAQLRRIGKMLANEQI